MSSGYLQLATKGAQDVYLTDQPQITFFKSVYRRHLLFLRILALSVRLVMLDQKRNSS